jgi:O-antigen/teichoic acid export membrane protein
MYQSDQVTLTRQTPLELQIVRSEAGLSLRSNFAWVLTGNLVYAACQWGMIVALAKLSNPHMVGQFALGLAIATPVLMFTNLHLRVVQASDAKRLYSFTEYLQLRIALTSAAMAVIAGVVWFGSYERRTAMVVMAVAVAKGIETLSDIHYGLFQLNDRLDQTGRSMILRGTLSVFALGVGLYLTRDVFWGCIGLALVWLTTLLLFDVRHRHRFETRSKKGGQLQRQSGSSQAGNRDHELHRKLELIRLALPLGIVATMASINLNMPRYFIHARMGEHQLGVFSATAYATVAMTLVSDALGHCAMPRLSRLYASGRLAQIRSLLFRLLAAGAAVGLAGVAIAQLMGARLLATFYSQEYAKQSRVFVMLACASAIQCISSLLNSGITSARCFRIQVPIFALAAAASALACARLVPGAGLAGGALAMVIGAVVHLVLAAAVARYLLMAPNSWMLGDRAQRGADK